MGFRSIFRRKAKYTNDPLKGELQQFQKYQLTLAILKKTVEGLELTLTLMKPVHDELDRNMQQLFSDGSGERVLEQSAMLSDHAKSAFDDSKGLYIAMKEKLDRLHSELNFLDKQIQDRTAAYSPKVHYETKMANFNKKPTEHGSEKIERNLRKSSVATNTWNELDAAVTRDLKRVLEERQKAVSEIIDLHVAHLARYYELCNKRVVILPQSPIAKPASPTSDLTAEPASPMKAETPKELAPATPTIAEPVREVVESPKETLVEKSPENPAEKPEETLVVMEKPAEVAAESPVAEKPAEPETLPALEPVVPEQKLENLTVTNSINISS